MPAIEFRDVHTTFGTQQVLAGIDLELHHGEFLAILGPSGCGKSTVLRIAGDLLPVSSGTVRVDGESPNEAWRRLAYVFQSPRLVPWRTAIGNVRLGLTLRYGNSLPKTEAARRADEAMDLVGLTGDKLKYPGVMSGGERQRVAIARALAVDPDVVLMDEPLSALDAQTKMRLRDEILRIWESTKKSVIFVTHDVDEALYLADRVLVFSNKPTTVVGDYRLENPRPRRVGTDPELSQTRREILGLLGVTDRGTNAE